jgi:hypothetical protein
LKAQLKNLFHFSFSLGVLRAIAFAMHTFCSFAQLAKRQIATTVNAATPQVPCVKNAKRVHFGAPDAFDLFLQRNAAGTYCTDQFFLQA